MRWVRVEAGGIMLCCGGCFQAITVDLSQKGTIYWET